MCPPGMQVGNDSRSCVGEYSTEILFCHQIFSIEFQTVTSVKNGASVIKSVTMSIMPTLMETTAAAVLRDTS